jgi:hypothetical protein
MTNNQNHSSGKTIHLSVGNHRFGIARAYSIDSWVEAERKWIFPNVIGGLNHFREQLPNDARPPILIFDDITVNKKYRRKSLGSAGVLAVLRYFQSEGAHLSFLRIGTQGEDWYTGKVWRQRMYQKLGWILLANHSSYTGDVPIMWHPMSGDLKCPRVEEIKLEIIDDHLLWFQIHSKRKP